MAQLPLLGYTIWWSLKGITVERPTLLQVLDQYGFRDYAPDLITPQTALKRALHAWVKEQAPASQAAQARGEDDDDETPAAPGMCKNKAVRDLVRPINNRSTKYATFALVAEHVNFQELGLRYGTEARILLEKVPAPERAAGRQPTLICTTEQSGVISAEQEARQLTAILRPRWEAQQQRYMAGDLARMISAIVSAIPGIVPLRAQGGIYFAPQSSEAHLQRLRLLIEALPTDGANEPYMMLLGIPDEAAAKRDLARAVHQGFINELRALNADLDDTGAKAANVRPSTVEARLVRYQRIRDRAKVYANLLNMQQQTIEEMLTDLQQKARALLVVDDVFNEEPSIAHVQPGVSPLPASQAAVDDPFAEDECTETHVSGDDLPVQARQAA